MLKKLPFIFGILLFGYCSCYGDALDHWTKVALTPYGSFNQIIYANGTFVALSAMPYKGQGYPYTNGVSFSYDGTRWTHLSCYTFEPSGIAFGNGAFVLAVWDTSDDGDSGALIATNSFSNIPPSGTPSDAFNGQYAVAYGNGLFVGFGYDYEGAEATFLTSTNGQNFVYQSHFNPSTSATNAFPTGIAYGNGRFLAVGYVVPSVTPSSRVFSSTDGTNWYLMSTKLPDTNSPLTLGGTPVPPLASINFVNGSFYAPPMTNGYPTNAYSSADGINWAPIGPNYPSIYANGTFSNGVYVSVHPGYPLATSGDGTNWLARNTGITNTLTCIAYGNNCFVACSADGSIFQSGSTIPSLAAQSTNGGFQLMVTDGIGPAYQVQASSDLVNWTNLARLTNIETSNQFLDLTATNYSQRYYRAVAQ